MRPVVIYAILAFSGIFATGLPHGTPPTLQKRCVGKGEHCIKNLFGDTCCGGLSCKGRSGGPVLVDEGFCHSDSPSPVPQEPQCKPPPPALIAAGSPPVPHSRIEKNKGNQELSLRRQQNDDYDEETCSKCKPLFEYCVPKSGHYDPNGPNEGPWRCEPLVTVDNCKNGCGTDEVCVRDSPVETPIPIGPIPIEPTKPIKRLDCKPRSSLGEDCNTALQPDADGAYEEVAPCQKDLKCVQYQVDKPSPWGNPICPFKCVKTK